MDRSTGGATRLRLARGGAAALAALVLVAACGSEGTKGSEGTDEPASAASGPAATSAPPSPAQPPPSAEDFLLTEGPETVGYTAGETPGPDGGVGNQGSSEEPDLAGVANCLGVDESVFDDDDTIDEASGADFTSDFAEFPTANSQAAVSLPETIAEQAEVVKHPEFANCFGGALSEELSARSGQDGLTYEIIAIEAVEPPPGANAVVRLSFGITADGQTFGFVLDTVYMFRGQVRVFLTFLNQGDVTPPGDVELMVSQIDAKLDQQ